MGVEFPNFNKEEKMPASQERPKKPGGELRGKPVQGPDEQWYNKFGEKISQDEAYAENYWGHFMPSASDKSERMEQAKMLMREAIESQAKTGLFRSFVDKTGITEKDKCKLSAYRLIAKEIGYEIGQFKFNKDAGTVTASLKKIESQE